MMTMVAVDTCPLAVDGVSGAVLPLTMTMMENRGEECLQSLL